MNLTAFILWELRPEIWPDGPLPLRWYGLFFAAAFAFGQFIITAIFRRDGKPASDVDSLTYHMIIGTVLGARLGHCLFYQPDYYLSNPLEILKVWEGGLASHGATAGIIIAMWLYARKRKDQSWLWILDRIVIVVALGGAFIRFGNLMNSEIIGKPSDLPWSMVFLQPFETSVRETEGEKLNSISFEKTGKEEQLDGKNYKVLHMHIRLSPGKAGREEAEIFARAGIPALIAGSNGDEEQLRLLPGSSPDIGGSAESGYTVEWDLLGLPRHPAMVYESISTFLIFLFLYAIWKKHPGLPEGRLFGLFVVVLFSLRFAYEFLKENQVGFEDALSLNMGQLLSIPLVFAGAWILRRSFLGLPEKK